MELSFDTNEGGLLAVDSHRAVPAPFLTKTFHFVDDPSTDDIVSWSEDGTTFIVWRPPEFAKDILPNYFKHNNFSSFVRQLNTYGFRKIVSDRWEFANEFFRKGQQNLLCEIHRRKTGQPSLQPPNVCKDVLWSHISSPLPSPRSSICTPPASASSHSYNAAAVSICDENERLRRDNCVLMSELARLRRLNDEVFLFLQNQARLPLQDLSSIKWLKYNSLPPLLPPGPSRFEEIVDDHNPGKLADCSSKAAAATAPPVVVVPRPSAVKENAAPKASTLSFLDGKLKELSSPNSKSSCEEESAPKLFGVILNRKRPCSPTKDDSSSSEEPHHKCPRLSLELNTDPCWLKVIDSLEFNLVTTG